MSTLLDEETTTVVLEALDFEVSCVQPKPEPHPAQFSMTCRACGAVEFGCLDHIRYTDHRLASEPLLSLVCRNCQASTENCVTELFVVVPL